jgi:uncharacterized protein (DUF1697 family)
MDRYRWLESQLDREDLTDEDFTKYNRELNELQAAKNERQDRARKLRQQQIEEENAEIALEKAMALTEEAVNKMYEDSCIKYQDVNGVSFKDWYQQSLKYYTIDEQFNVHAKARSANTVEIVPHISMAQAKLTILKRIRYKFYDHAVKGHDFAWE